MSTQVGFIIPTFNRGPILLEAIASAQEQTHRDLDVVVVDEGSTDDTADLVAGVAARDLRVRYLAGSHGGAAAARNAGLSLVTGDHVAFLSVRWAETFPESIAIEGLWPGVMVLGRAAD